MTLSAGIVLVRPFPDGYRFLLLRAYRYWDFPKGQVEPGEAPLQTARREVAEETGLTSIELKWGDAHVDTDPYGRGKVARYFLAESSKGAVVLPVNPELGRPEHHEHRWLSYDDAVPLLVERVRKVLDWAMVRIDGTGSS